MLALQAWSDMEPTRAAFTAVSAERMGGEGTSPPHAALDGRLVAVRAVSDPTRPTAMITGNNAGTARAIAAQLGMV